MRDVHLGFEIGTGEAVRIPIRNLCVTGQTQESGKTTTLEALITRSGATALTFVTKRGEGSFGSSGRFVQPYFRERADWQFVDALIEAALQEKNKYLRQFLIPICRTTKTLRDVQIAIQSGLKKATGQKQGALVQLDAYLELIVPEIDRAHLAKSLDIRPGLNVMNIVDFSLPMQMLFVQSAIEWVNENCENTIIVVPEAWEFIPEGKGSPVKLSAEKLVRKGSAIGNHIWVDSQDTAGIDKTILRGCPVWLIGVQREANEIKRNIANIPHPTQKPKAADVALLERGVFFVCSGKSVRKVYVQPTWLSDADAIAIAKGESGIQIARPKESEVNQQEAAALRHENEKLRQQVKDLTQKLEQILSAPKPAASPTVPLLPAYVPREDLPQSKDDGARTIPVVGDIDTIYRAIKQRLVTDKDPALLRVLQTIPEIEVRVERVTINQDSKTQPGTLAIMLANGFFREPITGAAVITELKRRGKGTSSSNTYRDLDRLVDLGFLTKETSGYQEVPGMKVNILG